AYTLRHSIRAEDMAVATHLSGGEFAILVVNVHDTKSLEQIKTRLQKNLEECGVPNSTGGKIHEKGETANQLLEAADKLMYEDKIRRKLESLTPDQKDAYKNIGAIAYRVEISLRDAPAVVEALEQ
ncbi:MAG: hypothetical protein ACREGF_07560, partial [Candidatus Saccharimonadales bacterium]